MSELARFHLGQPPPGIDDLIVDDGEPMETSRHREQMVQLIHTLRDNWTDRTDYYVGGNEFLYFSETQTKENDFRGPDVFVALGVEPGERKAWVTWLEGGKTPDVVIELVSVSTRDADYGEKKRIYADRLGVRDYFIYDPFSGRLDGFMLSPQTGDYIRLLPNAAGRLPVYTMGLELGVVSGDFDGTTIPWLRWFKPNGTLFLTRTELAQRALERQEAATVWANAEKQRADEEKQRADTLKQRADEEKQRADAANRLVEQEILARQALEARVRELEVQLQQRSSEKP